MSEQTQATLETSEKPAKRIGLLVAIVLGLMAVVVVFAIITNGGSPNSGGGTDTPSTQSQPTQLAPPVVPQPFSVPQQ